MECIQGATSKDTSVSQDRGTGGPTQDNVGIVEREFKTNSWQMIQVKAGVQLYLGGEREMRIMARSHPCVTTGKTTALTIQIFVSKVMAVPFKT